MLSPTLRVADIVGTKCEEGDARRLRSWEERCEVLMSLSSAEEMDKNDGKKEEIVTATQKHTQEEAPDAVALQPLSPEQEEQPSPPPRSSSPSSTPGGCRDEQVVVGGETQGTPSTAKLDESSSAQHGCNDKTEDNAEEEEDEWEWEESSVNPHRQRSEEEDKYKDQINEIEVALKEFLLNLADSNVRDYVNSELSCTSYRKFMDYYLQRDRMGEYSIRAELNRMDFEVIYDGKKTTDRLEITAIYESCPLHDLWKLANQSIYSEIITVLQRIFGDPSLSLRIASTSSSFCINFDENRLSAESNFEFLTLQDLSFRPLNKKPSDRLVLACMKGAINVDIKNRHVNQAVETPEISIVFDDELRASAKSILLFRQASEPEGDALAVIDRQLEETTEKAAALFSKATQAGSRALGNVVDVMGRLIKPNEDGADRGDVSANRNDSNSHVEDSPTVSFDDFINDAADPAINSNGCSNSTSGGWFTSATEGLVGSIGKLLQVEKNENIGSQGGSKSAGANQRPRNIFIRDDI